MPAKLLSEFNRHGLSKAEDEKVQAGYGPLLSAQVTEFTQLLDDLTTSVKRAKERFSSRGLLEEIPRLGREALTQLTKLSEHPPKKLAQDLRAVNAPSRLPISREVAEERREDATLTFLRHKELREHLREIDPLLQRPMLLDAVANNDTDLLAAISDAHPLIRPTPPDLIEEVKTEYLNTRMPEAGKVILQAQQVYESNVTIAKRVISKLTSVADDPIARAGMGAPSAA